MAATESTMQELGTKLPSFNLPDTVSNQNISSDILNKKANLVMFICNHCPFVIHVKDELSKIGIDYKDKDLSIVAISSNDIVNYPQDGPDKMKEFAKNNNFNFPYLYDESQEVAKSYSAACTPDFFLYDENQELVYRGQLDNSRPNNGLPVTGNDLRNAIDSLLNNQKPDTNQTPSIGCNIKWK